MHSFRSHALLLACAFASLPSVSCLPPLAVPAGGRIGCAVEVDCPAPLACDATLGRCIPRDGPCSEADGTGAAARRDGVPCAFDEGGDGLCIGGFCAVSRCGDGFADLDNDEQCDLGDENDDDEAGRCRTTCQAPRCGDGVVDVDEGCDDDNNADCVSCQLLCTPGSSDCDGRDDCECAPAPLDIALDRVFAMVADDDALYMAATAAGPGLSILRHGFDGTDVVLADDLDVFGELLLVAGHVAFATGGTLTAVPTAGGPPRVLLDAFFIAIDDDGDDIVVFTDDQDTVRVSLAGDVEVIGPPIPACASGAVIDGVAYAATDLGEVVRVDDDGLVVLAERQFGPVGLEIKSDGRALWWHDERGDLVRLDPRSAGTPAIRVARSPSTLAGSRPLELQVDERGYAWRAEISRDLASDDLVVVGALPTGPRMRARPDSVVDTVALGPAFLCFSSFDEVYCLDR